MIVGKDLIQKKYVFRTSAKEYTKKIFTFNESQRSLALKVHNLILKEFEDIYVNLYKYIPDNITKHSLLFLVEIINDDKLNFLYNRDIRALSVIDSKEQTVRAGVVYDLGLIMGSEVNIYNDHSVTKTFYKRLSDILRHEIEKTNDNRILDLYNLKYEM